MYHCWHQGEKATWQEIWAASRSPEWPLVDRQQGSGDLSPTITMNHILPKTWMDCKLIIPPASPDKNSVQVTPFTLGPFWNSEQRSQQFYGWTGDPQDWELRKGHSKLLSLWPFVLQKQKTNACGKEMESHHLCLKLMEEAPGREKHWRGREWKNGAACLLASWGPTWWTRTGSLGHPWSHLPHL